MVPLGIDLVGESVVAAHLMMEKFSVLPGQELVQNHQASYKCHSVV